MSLESISLSSLEKTKLQPLFQTALNEVLHSLYHETDIPGDRSITVKITFKPKDQYIITEMGCSHAVPGRKVNAIAMLEDDTIKIDTVSGDARQPDMLGDLDDKKNVRSIADAPSARKEGSVS